MNWFEAARICHLNDMKVITIESKEEQDRIANKIRESGE